MAATAVQLNPFVGKTITIMDRRTLKKYDATIMDAKGSWGKLRLNIVEGSEESWFEPSDREVKSIRD